MKIHTIVFLIVGFLFCRHLVADSQAIPSYTNGDTIHTSHPNGMIIKAKKGEWGGIVHYDSEGVVNGNIFYESAPYLVGNSILALKSDLILGSRSRLGGHGVNFSGYGRSLFLSGNLKLSYQQLGMFGDLTINGQGNCLELSAGSSFFSRGFDTSISSTLRFKNMSLIINEELWVVPNSQATIELEDVNVFLISNANIKNVRFLIKGCVNIYGTGKELCCENLRNFSGVQAGSVLYVGPGVVFSTKNIETRDGFDNLAASSTIWFDGCVVRPYFRNQDKIFNSKDKFSGWRLRRGNVFFGGAVSLDNVDCNSFEKNTHQSHSFELGNDGTREVNTVILPGAQITVNGYLYHNPL